MDELEIMHIVVSVVTISIAFSVFRLGSFPLVLATVGTGFVLHELAHKYVAKSKGCFAVYRAWIPGLAFAMLLAVTTAGRLVFAAPGAVYIGGKRLSIADDGQIALAGPLTNIVLGIIFFLLIPFVGLLAWWGTQVNFFLAAFNMVPFPPLDGYKVVQWNPVYWFVTIALAAGAWFFVPAVV
jgi:Zn-dependent protease